MGRCPRGDQSQSDWQTLIAWRRPTSPPPRFARGPFLSPRYAGGEDSMSDLRRRAGNHLTAPSSPGAPRRLRAGEQVAIIRASVST